MAVALAAVVVSVVVLALYLYAKPQRLSPDGKVYFAAARGERVPRPFHLRPLVPWLCGERASAWRVASGVGLLVACVLVALLAYEHGSGGRRAVFAAVLFAGLPLVRTTTSLPVLVDGPALAFAAGSAYLAATGQGPAAAVVALIGATAKEHVPVFAALAVMSPWPLVGLAAPVVLAIFRDPALPVHPSSVRPFGYAREKQSPRFFDATKMVLPWGVCLAALWAFTPAVGISLAVAYGLLLVSADSTRIYQWAAIPVCVAASSVIPEAWLLPAAVVHVFNPWQGEI